MRNTRLIWAAVVVLLLAACGGGGGGGGGNGGGSAPSGSTGSGGSTTNNNAPVALAGVRQNVRTGSVVRLDGSASSDADGDRISYEWTFSARPSDSNARLRNADGATPLFTADAGGRYVVKLVVSDGNAFSEADTVTVVATAANSVPVADAGNGQSVKTSSVVVLDGSRSTDADVFGLLSYRWSFVSRPTGSTAQLSNADTEMPSFTADAAGDYVVQLVVNDGTVDSSPARVTIVASTANAAPVADAGGDRGVSVSDTVALDGSASSDADGDTLGYAWQLVAVPPGSGASLNNADTAAPSFVADAAGSYVAQVTVTDPSGASDSDRVVIAAGPTLTLSADLANDGTFETVALPYDETLGQTVVHAPNTGNNNDNGFVLGRFRATAVGGDLTLNLSFGFTPLNDGASTGTYALAFDGFQGINTTPRQAVLAAGMTVGFALNVGIPENSLAIVSYRFTVVETGETFEASYMVQSDDN